MTQSICDIAIRVTVNMTRWGREKKKKKKKKKNKNKINFDIFANELFARQQKRAAMSEWLGIKNSLEYMYIGVHNMHRFDVYIRFTFCLPDDLANVCKVGEIKNAGCVQAIYIYIYIYIYRLQVARETWVKREKRSNWKKQKKKKKTGEGRERGNRDAPK